MRSEYNFDQGTRGKHVGKRLQVVGDSSAARLATKMEETRKSANNLIGTAGEYYVCAELCRQGYLALLTPKNNPLFDVVATTLDGTTSVSIQVKTRSVGNKQGWKLNKNIGAANTPGVPFVVLVNLQEEMLPDFYIYKYSEFVSRVEEVFENYMGKMKRSGEPRKDPGFRWFDEMNFTDADRARMNNWLPIIGALEGRES